uniref:Putative polyprotein n=1 Tax=Albugo laibachii Nc14 TaxID=890382 RepID=F0WYI2_9STRA|nr:putative polyprotein [Albugo laibachii Nc14]|eukprot:CCA26539.1 putative polyprotein [Albugo laibachii Nc14]
MNLKHKKQYNEQAFTVCEDMVEGWLLDSGASSHMCPFKEAFSEIRPLKKDTYISIANGSKISAQGIGIVPVILENKTPIRIENILYVPDLDRRLLSIQALAEKGLNVSFGKGICQIRDNERVVTQVTKRGKVYVMECAINELALADTEKHDQNSSDFSTWHARLGHLPIEKVAALENCIDGFKMQPMTKRDIDKEIICEGCINGKSSVQPFPKSGYGQVKSKSVLQLIHSDVMGPMETKSQGGARFMVTFIDDYSRYVVSSFVRHKSEVIDRFLDLKAMMENQ